MTTMVQCVFNNKRFISIQVNYGRWRFLLSSFNRWLEILFLSPDTLKTGWHRRVWGHCRRYAFAPFLSRISNGRYHCGRNLLQGLFLPYLLRWQNSQERTKVFTSVLIIGQKKCWDKFEKVLSLTVCTVCTAADNQERQVCTMCLFAESVGLWKRQRSYW